ncbi:unnamed protein product [Clonostachys solani]|uniref:Luciferase-like domain-containing protein n=1 Tax=Clonostachys solani TaxID=160281 RepID=A0A9P0EER0_9HYPO|nr:unnamed protein product [Clonostachys solani]
MSEGTNHDASSKRRIILNAFDMFTPSHLSFGQWRRDDDKSSTKRRDLDYWTNLARILERGDINALVIADTFGQHDVYKGSAETTLRSTVQFPMGDPSIPVTAMATVTKNLGFIITSSTSYESPFVVAKRFSTLDHLTKGRFGWNIVTSFKSSASKAVGLSYIEHDKRYEIADEYLKVLYKIWEGSWADDALKEDAENEIYVNPERVRWIEHNSENFNLNAPHILDPSPQRTPFLLQAGTSPFVNPRSAAGIAFAAKHAEGVMLSGLSPHILAPRVAALRSKAAEFGRNPRNIKVFAIVTPVLGETEKEAKDKYEKALKYASFEAGLAFYSGNAGIDLSTFDLDTEIKPEDSTVDSRIQSLVSSLKYRGADVPAWTPRTIGKAMAIGGNGPVPVGTPEQVADFLEEWVRIADLDGFNVGYVVSPGSFEDVVDLLVPELRRRGIYTPQGESGTIRERIYGAGQARLLDEHEGSKYKYDNYDLLEK